MALSSLLLNDEKKGCFMEYLVLAGAAAMMLLYAVIIVECIKHPEW